MPSTVYLAKYPVHCALANDPSGSSRAEWNLNDPMYRHRAVMAIFPKIDYKRPRSLWNVLFRLDSLPGQAPFFLIQSTEKPLENISGLEVIQRELPEYEPGTAVRFRISINGIRRTNGKAVPVPFDSDSESSEQYSRMTPWLQGKLAGALKDVSIINHIREVLGVDRVGKHTHDLVVQVDTIDGVAVVEDTNRLNELVLSGVGRAKSYGCGLLSVAAL